jgi:hypothetical protein
MLHLQLVFLNSQSITVTHVSNRNAPTHCRKCNKVIQEGEPLWRDSYMLPYWWKHYRGNRIECLTCTEVGKDGGKVPLGHVCKIIAACCRCDGCGREVWRKYRHSRKYKLHSFCTEKCEQQYYTDRLKSRRALTRERSCIQCGVTFTPQRSDGRTCSNKCRQARYRKLAIAA